MRKNICKNICKFKNTYVPLQRQTIRISNNLKTLYQNESIRRICK